MKAIYKFFWGDAKNKKDSFDHSVFEKILKANPCSDNVLDFVGSLQSSEKEKANSFLYDHLKTIYQGESDRPTIAKHALRYVSLIHS